MFISIMHSLQSFPSRRFMSDKSGVTISCVWLVLGAGGESLHQCTCSLEEYECAARLSVCALYCVRVGVEWGNGFEPL